MSGTVPANAGAGQSNQTPLLHQVFVGVVVGLIVSAIVKETK